MPAKPTIEQLREIAKTYGMHPAMTLPCGLSNGMPGGMMLVGRKWNDATVLRAAYTFEQTSGYTVRPQQTPAVAGQ